MDHAPIVCGSYLRPPGRKEAAQLVCEDRRLVQHLDRPWFRAYLARRCASIRTGAKAKVDRDRTAKLSSHVLARHGFCAGATGSGKSRALLGLLFEQLRNGCSAVVLDPKGETIDRMLAQAAATNLPPSALVLLDPHRLDCGPPGWNPLATGIPLAQAAMDLCHIMERASQSWGPRMQDVLLNSLILAGSHGLSAYEVARLLVDSEYRDALLNRSVCPSEPLAYDEARAFFAEFSSWGKSERAGAIAPVLTRLREWLRSPFLRPLLCPKRNTLDLASLWQQPRLVLVRLDIPSLGESGVRLLAGLFTNQLLRTALRARGPVPVVLAIDELPMVERFIGTAISDIVAVARSQNLRCLVAYQGASQLSDGLLSSLQSNCAYQLNFRCSPKDARIMAAALAVGHDDGPRRIEIAVDKEVRETREPERAEWRHRIYDAAGQALRPDEGMWRLLWSGCTDSTLALDRLYQWALGNGARRIYVKSADSGEPVELRRYLAGVEACAYRLEGPALQLVVSFPRPRIKAGYQISEADAARSWSRCLQELPVQHAVLNIAELGAGVIRVVDVPTPVVGKLRRDRLIGESVQANGQTADQIASDIRSRTLAVEQAAGGHPRKEKANDDSLF